MAKRSMTTLSVAELERMLKSAKRETETLAKERAGLEKRMADIDRRLAELGGTKKQPAKARRTKAKAAKPAPKPAGKGAGRKKMTLTDHVTKILGSAKTAMSPAQITQAMRKKGVSKSKFLSIQVQQILRSGKVAVRKVDRGQYVLAGDE